MDWEKYEKIENEFINLSEKIALSFALSTVETQELIQRCLLEPLVGFRAQVRNAFMDMEYNYTPKDKDWGGEPGIATGPAQRAPVPEFSELDLSDSKPPPPPKSSKRKKK